MTFESHLAASPGELWDWATSPHGISGEMWPLAKMTFPAGHATLADAGMVLGRPLCRSWLLLFGLIPVDRLDLTLLEVDTGRRFLEQSPMLSMRCWRHERIIEPCDTGARVTDKLEFAPRLAGPVLAMFVKLLFRHRHRVLRQRFGDGAKK
ncbi:hypothetical protein [Massilia sp. GCM10023247]|uniref:hypothetical protein n=1 Tax=Massilia sp. GCM10023247 TaxID=3252643 RepID=UPI00360F7112